MSANNPRDFVAVNVNWSGCALLIGDTGVGADALSVEPSGAAGDSSPAGDEPGDTGFSFCLEQAIAAARTAAHVQSRNLFWNIQQPLNALGSARWERATRI